MVGARQLTAPDHSERQGNDLGRPAVGTLLLIGVAYEINILGNDESGDTSRNASAAWLRVHARPGHVAFMATWSAFAVWFLGHIGT